VRHGQPEFEQVLLWLRKLTIVRNMFLLQPSQSALRGVLQLVRTQAQDQVVERNLDLRQFTLFSIKPRFFHAGIDRRRSTELWGEI
jgi:hypothetical protein